eukprot:PhM_4_TR10049/c0_g1_i1/m.99370
MDVTLALSTPTAPCSVSTCVHGVCDPGTNICRCHASTTLGFFAGPQCNVCADGYMESECRQRGTCAEGTATCLHGTCSPGTDKCVCTSNATHGHWSGGACDQCAASTSTGFWSGGMCTVCLSGFGGSLCTTPCISSQQCSGHGVCRGPSTSTGTATASVCECYGSAAEGYWSGDSCSRCAPGYVDSAAGRCTAMCIAATTCSGHGTCEVSSGGETSCRCYADATRGYYSTLAKSSTATWCSVCDDDHVGSDCRTVKAGMPACTPTTCGAHGACEANGNCACHDDAARGHWEGPRCDRCISDTSRGMYSGAQCIECVPGYWGATCSLECPNSMCSGRGTCTRDSGQCICGNRPSLTSPPQTSSEIDVSHFDAATACATCAASYYGEVCNIYCDAATSCNGHGACETATGK